MYTKWTHRIVLLIVAVMISAASTFAGQRSQDNVWERIDRSELRQPGIDAPAFPNAYDTFRLNRAALEAILNRAPEEFTSGPAVILTMPMPDGTFSRFEIEHSLVVEPGLLDEYPELGATYRARGIDDRTAYARFDLLPSGFHLMVLSARGTVIVNPYATGDTENYISFFKRDHPRVGEWQCFFRESDPGAASFESITNPKGFDERVLGLQSSTAPDVTSGSQLRTYRFALAANNEYCVAVGSNTIAGTLAAEVLIMNRVNGVYERDLAMRMNIIANNNLITYAADNTSCGGPCNAGNDPYSNGPGALNQNTPNLNTVIGFSNYDIGHVFTTGSGGVAFLGVPCGANKGGGTTGLPNPVGDPFAIDFVAHEIGHQWGANHTFNASCGGNRAANAAYEPGSGITIMGYAGVCDGVQELAAHSIDTFHVKSLEEMVQYSQIGQGNTCAVTTASGNTPPTVTGPGNFNIPKQTPFSLTATSSDPEGDSVTYDWQEYDLGAVATAAPNEDLTAIRPIFRPYLPAVSGTRTFPRLNYILNNANVPPTYVGGAMAGELLPQVNRTMNFQVIARDNHAGAGGINTATSALTIVAAAGPFAVTSPNTAVTYPAGSTQTVTWDVANTNNVPVSAANVKISFSSDGGNTFPTVLAASTANDGSESVTMPNINSSTCRIKIEAVGNIFFDISNTNFILLPAGVTPTPTPSPACTPSWAAGGLMPETNVRSFGVYFPANGKFYAMGGRADDSAGSDALFPFEYDPATNMWTTKSALYPDNQVNNMACGLLTAGGTPLIYCVGGSEAGAPAGTPRAVRVFTYNPVTDTIAVLPPADNWPGGNTNLPGGGAVLNNKLYTIGGFAGTAMIEGVWEFDPNAASGSRWTTKASLPVQRGYVPAVGLGGFIYVVGGSAWNGTTLQDSFESFRYDPAANTWTAIPSPPRATGETRAVVMNNQVWVLGGGRTGPTNPSKEVNIYDPATNAWSLGPPFGLERRNFAADSDPATFRIWIGGGYGGNPTTTIEDSTEVFTGCPVGPSPSPSLSPSPTPTPITPTPTPTPITPTPSPTPTFTVGPSPTPTPISPTPSPTPTATVGPSPTPTSTVGPSPTPTATVGPSPSPSPTCPPGYTTSTTTGTLTAGGTDTGNHCDDCATLVLLPFPVTVYGTQTSVAYVGSNGTVQLTSTFTAKPFYFMQCLPVNPTQGGPFLDTMFAYYDDLRTDEVGTCPDCGIFTQTVGSAPNREFIIRGKHTYFNHAGTAEYEVRLPENSGTLSIIYGPSEDSGLLAASGIQHDLNIFTSFSCNQATLTSGLRVDYVPTGCPGTPTPTPSPTATVPASPTPTPPATPSPSPTPILRFCNPAPIDMTLNGPAVPYPSTITVAGAPSVTGGVIVTLNGVYHQFPDNIDVLLVGPQGQKYVLMADAGGPIPIPQANAVTLILRDFQPNVLPNNGPLTSGTFMPTNWETPVLSFAPPAPPAPYTEPGNQPFPPIGRTLFGTFGLLNPNGVWSLYVRDDGGNPLPPEVIIGSISGGWCIEFLPPTAAGVSISGRVSTAEGAGIRNARVVVTGNSLPEARVVTTGSFGYYSLEGLTAGETYVVTVNSTRYTFQMPSRVYHLVDNITNADFVADPFSR